MLTIKNIAKIRGREILVRGYRFEIGNIFSDESNYWITLEYPGTAHAPITLLLRREATVDVQNGILRYALKKDTTTDYSYVSLEGLGNPDEFVGIIQRYLNNL